MEQYNEKIGTRKDLVSYRIETAKSDLKSAKILLNAGEYKGANNRAYYAIFHAINAVHALDGRAFKRHKDAIATVYKGNIIKNLIMDCQSYTKYRPNETTGGIFVSWRRKEELPTGA